VAAPGPGAIGSLLRMPSNRDRLAPRRVLGRRLAAVAISFTLLAALGGDSSASLGSKLEAAKQELTSLTATITAQESRAQDLQGQVSGLADQIVAATEQEATIAGNLVAVQRQMDEAAAQAAEFQGKLDAMAAEMFMQGGSSALYIEPLLSSTSMADFNDRITYADAVGRSSADLGAQVASARAALSFQAAELSRLASQEQALVSGLNQARADKATALSDERQALADLEQTKAQIVALIVKLHRQLEAQELASVADAFQGSGHVTYGSWAGLFLKTMGVSGCHENKVVVVAWQYSEFTQAAWNPLATTHVMPGSTDFNSTGVQNYPSLQVGLQATKETIHNGLHSYGYGAILSSLASCADAMTTAQAINASSWCAGCVGGAYVTGVVPKVEADYAVYAAL
jgi:peptidoglycan hydrolase CwlO-like protein